MLGRFLIFLLAAAAAVAASQVPEFAQQYRQRLGGAIDELRIVVGRFDADAQRVALDRSAALDQMQQADLPLVRAQASSMEENIRRLQKLTDQQEAFRGAGAFGRLMALASYFDPMLLQATYASFEPAVPVTVEGFVLAGLAFVLVWAALRGLVFLMRRPQRPRRTMPVQKP